VVVLRTGNEIRVARSSLWGKMLTKRGVRIEQDRIHIPVKVCGSQPMMWVILRYDRSGHGRVISIRLD